jgi:MFS family permease
MSLLLIGTVTGIVAIVVGVPVTIMGGYLSDRFRRFGKGGRMRFSMCAALASVPLWALLLFTDSKPLLLALNGVLFALAISWLGPAAADVHDIAGPHLRGLGIGIYFSTVNICAYGIGSPLIGKLSDLLGVSSNPGVMRFSLLVCLVACVLSALMLWRGSRALQALEGRAQ